MVDKKDMNDLLPCLERLCIDYRAMEYILDHYHPDGPHWRKHLSGSQRASRTRVEDQFREMRDKIRSARPDEQLLDLLLKALDNTTLLEPL